MMGPRESMSTPPAPLHDELADRSFSFYPPILGVEHNEWRLREATWSELVVRNTKTDLEVPIPRKMVGSVAQVDEPVMIVGLTRELEYRTGSVWPTERKVRAMPAPPIRPVLRMPGLSDPAPGPKGFEAMVGRGGDRTENKITRLILFAFSSIAIVGLLFWALVRLTPDARPTYVGKDQGYLELTREDDYHAIVRRLGRPAEDRWKQDAGELQFRALGYPDRGYIVILMGTDKDAARYVGSVVPSKDGKKWTAAHGVESARGAGTLSLIRGLKPF
jgi:hypothetical protein